MPALVRTYVLRDLIREQEAGHLSQEAELVAAIVADAARRRASSVDEEFLDRWSGPTSAWSTTRPARRRSWSPAPDYEGSDDPDEDLSASRRDGGGARSPSASPATGSSDDIVGRDIGSIAALFLLIGARPRASPAS